MLFDLRLLLVLYGIPIFSNNAVLKIIPLDIIRYLHPVSIPNTVEGVILLLRANW